MLRRVSTTTNGKIVDRLHESTRFDTHRLKHQQALAPLLLSICIQTTRKQKPISDKNAEGGYDSLWNEDELLAAV